MSGGVQSGTPAGATTHCCQIRINYYNYVLQRAVVQERAGPRLPPRLVPHRVDRDLAEIEAESVAFIVCNASGIDSASYTLPYVAKWAGGDVDRIRPHS